MDIQLPKSISTSSLKIPPSGRRARTPWIEAVLLLVIIVLSFIFLVLPKKSTVAAEQGQLDALNQTAEEMSKNLDTLKSLAQQLQQHAGDVAKLDEGLPLRGSTIELQMLLENLSQTSALTTNDISIGVKSDAIVSGNTQLLANPYGASRSLQKFQATVSVTGSLDNLIAFMQKLESNGRILNVTAFNITTGKDNELEMTLYIDAYYYSA
jgi:Tfp pilus assembly protein PilO